MKPSIQATHHTEARPLNTLDTEILPALYQLRELTPTDVRHRALRNTVVERALPLADRLARRFENRGESLEDLTQVARLGLINAVEHFHTDHGASFTSFAVPSIMGELKRHFRDKGWLIRVPRRFQETRLALNKAYVVLTQELGRSPTEEEYAEYLSMPTEQVRAGIACSTAYAAISLNVQAHRESTEELIEVLGGDDGSLYCAETRMFLGPALKRLTDRERVILGLRFVQDLHQTEIAERVGLSQMHVSRLLRQTLGKLRRRLDDDPEPESVGA